ncbi:hypothetical protein Tco_0116090 [Tanacetum coccineum]
MNLALHMEGKKKVNPLMISGVHFTKLIINHLQSIHKFHKRPGSLLHLPYEESALGYLKLSFKNTKRVRFGMAIPNTLIFEEIRSAPYYSEYVAKVTKYQRYLAGEVVMKMKLADNFTKGKRKKSYHGSFTQHLGGHFHRWLIRITKLENKHHSKTPKKKNPAKQFIFQRRTPAPTIPSSMKNPLPCQDGSDPGKLVEGQAGSDPGVAADSRIQLSHVVHAGPNLEHMNLEVSDTSPQPNPEQIDKEFTITAYPNVQENLKIPTEGEVRLEEPASSAGTLSSMQNLDKELRFTNQFLAEKS